MVDCARMIIRLPFSNPIAEITGSSSAFINAEWNDEGDKLLSMYQGNAEQGMKNTVLTFLYRDMAKEILSRIRLLRHGGTIIFVADGKKWKTSIEKPFNYESLHRYNGLQQIENRLSSEVDEIEENSADLVSKRKHLAELLRSLRSYEKKTLIGEAARTVAYLTAVDGAAILTKNFDVLAFGVKIKEKPQGRTQQKVLSILPYEAKEQNSESSLTHEFRGKRHLSAARFVIDNPDSCAFVVSQDGGITGFVVDGGKLLAYKGLELLL